MRPLLSSEEPISGSLDLQHVFVARLAGIPVPDMREVVEVETFEVESLPENVGRLSRRRIEEWLRTRA